MGLGLGLGLAVGPVLLSLGMGPLPPELGQMHRQYPGLSEGP